MFYLLEAALFAVAALPTPWIIARHIQMSPPC
jgi:hypothetical protein